MGGLISMQKVHIKVSALTKVSSCSTTLHTVHTEEDMGMGIKAHIFDCETLSLWVGECQFLGAGA